MANKIDNCFARLRSEKRKGFIPYICAGDPSLDRTVDLALALEKAGADMLELGLPFSDPLADGIVNQLAARGWSDHPRRARMREQDPQTIGDPDRSLHLPESNLSVWTRSISSRGGSRRRGW